MIARWLLRPRHASTQNSISKALVAPEQVCDALLYARHRHHINGIAVRLLLAFFVVVVVVVVVDSFFF